MVVTLPGGLWAHDQLNRNACFASLNGHTELALAELDASHCPTTDFVTRALCLTLSELGDKAPDPGTVESLCVADRQFLMLRLGEMLNGDDVWLRASCSSCDKFFDLHIQRSALPIKEAAAGFPLCAIDTRHGRMELRVPTGRDQNAVIRLSDDQAMISLLKCCVVSIDGQPVEAAMLAKFNTADIREIEQALDDISPSVCDALQTDCPECSKQQTVRISHYDVRVGHQQGFYQEVHQIASYYHWGEEEILAIPRVRRQMYLELIARDSGAEA